MLLNGHLENESRYQRSGFIIEIGINRNHTRSIFNASEHYIQIGIFNSFEIVRILSLLLRLRGTHIHHHVCKIRGLLDRLLDGLLDRLGLHQILLWLLLDAAKCLWLLLLWLCGPSEDIHEVISKVLRLLLLLLLNRLLLDRRWVCVHTSHEV